MEKQRITQSHLDDACGNAELKGREVICRGSKNLCEYIFTEYVEHLSNLAACPRNPYVKGTFSELKKTLVF